LVFDYQHAPLVCFEFIAFKILMILS